MQNATNEAVGAIQAIGQTIQQINGISSLIAATADTFTRKVKETSLALAR